MTAQPKQPVTPKLIWPDAIKTAGEALVIEEAVKQDMYLKMALAGGPGCGKTFTSLQIGCELARLRGGVACLIDTQNRQSLWYANRFRFKVIHLETFDPRLFILALHKCMLDETIKVVILDSFTHEWNGIGGMLDLVSGDGTKWKDVNPLHAALIQYMRSIPRDVIATMRAHQEHSYEKENGRTIIRPLGIEAVQGKEAEFEFDAYGMLDEKHNMTVRKSVLGAALAEGEVIANPGVALAKSIYAYCTDETRHDEQEDASAHITIEDAKSAQPQATPRPPVAPAQVTPADATVVAGKARHLMNRAGYHTIATQDAFLAELGIDPTLRTYTAEVYQHIVDALKAQVQA